MMWCNPNESFKTAMGLNERLRLVLVEDGTGILRTGEHKITLIAPSILCINEKEHIVLEQSVDLKARAVYFHPEIINGLLNFENIRKNNKDLPLTCTQDSCWLKPFWKRDSNYNGSLYIGPGTCQRISKLMDLLSNQLNNQPDNYWPCRSRSFFLEILFMLERIYMNPESREELILNEPGEDVEKVLLYLHTNYQKKVTITELCKEFHINRTTLQERFIKATGFPVMTYLIKLRLKLASLMLRDTMVSATEVMERTGFSDITHFGKMFKKYMGCAPTEYRQQYCWMIK